MTKKLLLADDSITIQKVIGIIFATEDYQLIVCDDGDEAFSKALEEYPDLVIADVSMPGKDGFELCEAIKSTQSLAHTSVLLLPGTFEHFDESRAEAVAADGWLSKPFESQALLDKVSQLIDAAPLRLGAAEETPEEVVDFSAAPVVAEESGVDEVALGLDEVEELGAAVDDSADDIWDAVSFEEEDLQQAEEAPVAEPLELSPESEEESDFSFSEEKTSLELTDEVIEESVEEPAAEIEDASLELTEEETVSFDEPAGDEDLSVGTEEVLPVVEPVSEDSLDEDEEILDLVEDDILEEETVEEAPGFVAEPVEEQRVEEPVVDQVEELSGAAAEEPLVLEEEPVTEEPELSEVEMAVEEEVFEEPVEEFAPEFPLEQEPVEPLVYTEPIPEPEPEELVSSFDPVPATEEEAPADIQETVVEQVEQQLRELSEEELKEVVAKVAGPTIEKLANEMLEQVVWEVVPDLAESMIREEIRKIRQGAE